MIWFRLYYLNRREFSKADMYCNSGILFHVHLFLQNVHCCTLCKFPFSVTGDRVPSNHEMIESSVFKIFKILRDQCQRSSINSVVITFHTERSNKSFKRFAQYCKALSQDLKLKLWTNPEAKLSQQTK